MANDALPQWAGDTKRADAQKLEALIKAKRERERQQAIEKGALTAGAIQTANISSAMEELAQRTQQANQAAGIGVQAPLTGMQAGAAQGRGPLKKGWDRFTDENMGKMLSSRMGWNLNPPTLLPFDKCIPCKVTEEKAVVFIVTGGKALLIEDDLGLYPSDALITQLRLLEP